MKKNVIILFAVLTMIICLCGCGNNKNTGSENAPNITSDSNKSEDLLNEAAKQNNLPALSSQTVEEELKSSGMAKQYSLRADKFEITNVSIDPDGKRQMVSCHIILSNENCTAEETADIIYCFNDTHNNWEKERCNIKSQSITPRSNPTDENVKEQVRKDHHIDKNTNLNFEILDKGNVDGNACKYYAKVKTASPITEYLKIFYYIEKHTYTVNYTFSPTLGWSGYASHNIDEDEKEYSVSKNISGHYEGTASVPYGYTEKKDFPYRFDLTVSEDGKDVILENVYLDGYPNPYRVSNQAKIREAVQNDCNIIFYLASPEGTVDSNSVGTVWISSYLEDKGPIALFGLERLNDDLNWGVDFEFSVPLHF